jgi:putative spermidine/putrescine transport system permease protein
VEQTAGGCVTARLRPWLPVAPALAVVGLLFGGALTGALRTSVAPLPGQPATLDAWRRVLGDPAFLEAVGFTVALAVVSTVVSVLLALPVAGLLRGRALVQAVVTLPVLVPHLLVAALAVLWLGPGGLADRVVDGLPVVVRDGAGIGIVLVYVLKEVPFLALLVLAAWDDRVAAREEAAASLGAGTVARLRHVVWPAVRARVVLGATVVAAFVLGSLAVPAVIGPTTPLTVPAYALRATRLGGLGGLADASVALLLASLLALGLAVAAGLLVRRLDGVRLRGDR